MVDTWVMLGDLRNVFFEHILDVIVTFLLVNIIELYISLHEASSNTLAEEMLANGSLTFDVSDAQVAIVRS